MCAASGCSGPQPRHYEETIYSTDGVLPWTVDGNKIDLGPGRLWLINSQLLTVLGWDLELRGKFFAIEALREFRFPVEQDGCSPNASSVTAVHRRQTNPVNVRQRRSRCLCPCVPMMKPAESRFGANFAGAIRFLLDQAVARRLLTQTDAGFAFPGVVEFLR